MNILFSHPAIINPGYQPAEHLLVSLHELPQNTSEGSEFLDDALRMEDLPRIRIEESVAAGSPEYLL